MGKKLWPLILTLFLQGIALGLLALIYETPLGSFLFLNLNLSEKLAYGIDDVLGVLLLILSTLFLFWRKLPILLYMAFSFFIFGLFQTIMGGEHHSSLTLLAHATRYVTPIAFYFILKDFNKGIILLKIGISITFLAHGIEALLKNPVFLDYLLYAYKNFNLTESCASYILLAIGIMDIILAILAIYLNNRWVYFYMVFWGFLTASYRVFYEGNPGLISLFIRSNHFLVPLFLGIQSVKQSSKKGFL